MNGYLTAEDIFSRSSALIGTRTGLITPPVELLAESGNPDIIVYTSALSRLEQALPHIELRSDDGLLMAGSGSSMDRKLAKSKAICEALERYSNISFDPASVVVSSRNALGESALDLNLYHRGHDSEYQVASGHVRPDNSQKIRWVKGHSLVSGRELWVPFAAVYISTPYKYPGEAFVIPISTGCALAGNYERAAVSGTLELIERDTLSLAWLQQMPLKRIDYSASSNTELWERVRRIEAAGIEQHFFDATTDLGFPTAYLLQIAKRGDLHVLVMAATRLNIEDAMIRVMDEASSSRAALEKLARKPALFDPANYASFTRLTDGAVYYANPENRKAFDFLLDNPETVPVAQVTRVDADDEKQMLDAIVAAFAKRNLELIAVDITAPQLRQIGLRVIRMLAPQLLPLTVNYNMKYGATPRLYQAPERMGLPVHSFEGLNKWPQPFA
jgi:ribosomal protein S12 methylthiotransferase accessory factor